MALPPLHRYQGEMTELSQWLQGALEHLEYWSTQAMVVPQDPGMVRDHLYTFLVHEYENIFSFFLF